MFCSTPYCLVFEMTDPNARRRNEKLDLTGRPVAFPDHTVAGAAAAKENFPLFAVFRSGGVLSDRDRSPRLLLAASAERE
jgi:hypothetical protein